jgi:hypothetical protein
MFQRKAPKLRRAMFEFVDAPEEVRKTRKEERGTRRDVRPSHVAVAATPVRSQASFVRE